jgi:hypothetical protein
MAKVYVCKDESSADLKVFYADSESWADLCFYEEDSAWGAENKDEYWFFVDNASEATVSIYWETSESYADLKVFRVRDKSSAQWRVSHFWRNRLS